MTLLHRLWSGIRALLWRAREDRQLDAELRDYFETAVEQQMTAGLSRDEARRAARLEMGSAAGIKDDVREATWDTHVDSILQDLRYAVRSFAKTPRFTIPALLTLALGIGTTTAIFSVVRSVMLEPLPYRDVDRIVGIWETNRNGGRNVIAPANFVEWLERAPALEHIGMVGPASAVMIVNRQPDVVSGLTFSSEVFRALGVQPALGRAFTAAEDVEGHDDVIILSHEFWQQRLGGRADVLDLTLTTDGRRRAVVGVMAPGFTVAGQKTSFLVPYGWTIEKMRAVTGRDSSYGIARLRDGMSFEQASKELRALGTQLEKEAPQRNSGRTIVLVPIQEQMVAELRPALLTLVGGVALVLLVACVNVANLLLARSAARDRELGMRAALGARRARLVRQMITESLVLAAAGGVAGLLVALLCHRGLLTLVGDRIPIPRLDQISLDPAVMAFTMVTALAAGLLFGIAPAFVSTSRSGEALRDGGRHGAGRRMRRTLDVLVVVEVALSLVLLTAAGLLMRSFVKLQSVDPGFRAEGVLTAQIRLPATYDTNAKADGFFGDMLARASALPGVTSAAGVGCLPLSGPCIGTRFWRVDRPTPGPGQAPTSQVRPVTPASFKTLGIPQLTGRDFAASDTAETTPVAIVSDSLAKQYFEGDNPLGRRVRINTVHASGDEEAVWTIVGVVGDVKGTSLEAAVRPTIYVPIAQTPWRGMTLTLRTRTDPMTLANSLTHAVHALDAEVPVTRIRTLEDFVGGTIARPRAISVLLAVFALLALALAAVGVYGVMAFSVLERTQEIGVRMALGASTQAVFRLVLGHALRLVLLGVAAGLFAAGALTRLLERLLFGVHPLDPSTFGTTALVLLAVAALASYIPARRGTRIAPVEALRTQ